MSEKEIEKIKASIVPLLQPYGLKRLGLFGSVARGEGKNDSDVDILVEIEKDISLLHFVHLKLQIEDSLGRKVDLVEYKTIKPRLREKILREQIVLL